MPDETGEGEPPQRSRSRVDSFRHAFAGWWYVLRTQRNAWLHAIASVAVLALASWLVRSPVHWVLLIQAMALVWMAEFFNTALEAVVDLASPQRIRWQRWARMWRRPPCWWRPWQQSWSACSSWAHPCGSGGLVTYNGVQRKALAGSPGMRTRGSSATTNAVAL
jgi:diacylglycerol kinase